MARERRSDAQGHDDEHGEDGRVEDFGVEPDVEDDELDESLAGCKGRENDKCQQVAAVHLVPLRARRRREECEDLDAPMRDPTAPDSRQSMPYSLATPPHETNSAHARCASVSAPSASSSASQRRGGRGRGTSRRTGRKGDDADADDPAPDAAVAQEAEVRLEARKGKVEREEQDRDEVLDLFRERRADLLGDDEADEEGAEDGVAAGEARGEEEGEKEGGRRGRGSSAGSVRARQGRASERRERARRTRRCGP